MPGIKDIGDLIERYATDFLAWFLSLLTQPLKVGAEIYSAKQRLVFLVFCTLIGATVGSLIPGRPPINDRTTVAVTVVVLWTFTSVLIHVVCKILRGHGTLNNTILSMLQILAVAYVVSNFLTMLTTSAAALYPPAKAALASINLAEPGTLILSIQFVMLALYTPFVLTSVHRFQGLIIGLLSGLMAAGIAVLLATPVALAGHC
jgi:hypothetical protein